MFCNLKTRSSRPATARPASKSPRGKGRNESKPRLSSSDGEGTNVLPSAFLVGGRNSAMSGRVSSTASGRRGSQGSQVNGETAEGGDGRKQKQAEKRPATASPRSRLYQAQVEGTPITASRTRRAVIPKTDWWTNDKKGIEQRRLWSEYLVQLYSAEEQLENFKVEEAGKRWESGYLSLARDMSTETVLGRHGTWGATAPVMTNNADILRVLEPVAVDADLEVHDERSSDAVVTRENSRRGGAPPPQGPSTVTTIHGIVPVPPSRPPRPSRSNRHRRVAEPTTSSSSPTRQHLPPQAIQASPCSTASLSEDDVSGSVISLRASQQPSSSPLSTSRRLTPQRSARSRQDLVDLTEPPQVTHSGSKALQGVVIDAATAMTSDAQVDETRSYFPGGGSVVSDAGNAVVGEDSGSESDGSVNDSDDDDDVAELFRRQHRAMAKGWKLRLQTWRDAQSIKPRKGAAAAALSSDTATMSDVVKGAAEPRSVRDMIPTRIDGSGAVKVRYADVAGEVVASGRRAELTRRTIQRMLSERLNEPEEGKAKQRKAKAGRGRRGSHGQSSGSEVSEDESPEEYTREDRPIVGLAGALQTVVEYATKADRLLEAQAKAKAEGDDSKSGEEGARAAPGGGSANHSYSGHDDDVYELMDQRGEGVIKARTVSCGKEHSIVTTHG